MLNNLIKYEFIHKKTKIYINMMPYLYHELSHDLCGYDYTYTLN